MSKPLCAEGDFKQAKKWIWKTPRAEQGGYWLCWDHFNAFLRDGKIEESGNNYQDVPTEV